MCHALCSAERSSPYARGSVGTADLLKKWGHTSGDADYSLMIRYRRGTSGSAKTAPVTGTGWPTNGAGVPPRLLAGEVAHAIGSRAETWTPMPRERPRCEIRPRPMGGDPSADCGVSSRTHVHRPLPAWPGRSRNPRRRARQRPGRPHHLGVRPSLGTESARPG